MNNMKFEFLDGVVSDCCGARIFLPHVCISCGKECTIVSDDHTEIDDSPHYPDDSIRPDEQDIFDKADKDYEKDRDNEE